MLRSCSLRVMTLRVVVGSALIVLLAAASRNQVQGQFKWEQYADKNNKLQFYPHWVEFKADGTAYIDDAVGKMTLTTGTTLDEATVKIYRPTGVPGGFSPTPSITLTAGNPGAPPNTIAGPNNIAGVPMQKSWTITWGDNILAAQVVPTGETVKVEVTVKTTSGGKQTTSVLAPTTTSLAVEK